jgi:hypothetical protein
VRAQKPIKPVAYAALPGVKSPKGGQPRRFNQALADKIIRLTEGGLTVHEMALACGIADSSLYWWLRGSAAGLPGYGDFHTRYYRARVVGYNRKWGTPPDGPAEPEAPAKESSG